MAKSKLSFVLAVLTLGALVIHGYHPYVEDAEIYLPGIEKTLQPALFPSGTEFFRSHAGLTLFPNLIAASVRLTRLPLAYALLLWQFASIFLLLLASWQFSGTCFEKQEARWGAVVLMSALLTLPVAGTALYIMDQYVNPRNLAAIAALFASTRVLQGKLLRATLWLVLGMVVHPLMASFAAAFCLLLVLENKFQAGAQPAIWLFLLPELFVPPTPAYHEAMRFHTFHFIAQWQWYEWLGILAPAAIFWSMGRMAGGESRRNLRRVSRTLVVYNLAFFVAALAVSLPKRFEALARIQPLRSLHLLYMVLVLFGGGLIAEHALKKRLWRWLMLFLPLCLGMYWAQCALFPVSSPIEWPWVAPKNRWTQAFLWIRENTPTEALFSIDPFYTRIAAEEAVGFRACAERSRLADAAKDSGAVSMFPPLAEEWWQQFTAQRNWKQFQKSDFLNLQRRYGVGWVVLEAPGLADFDCPYRNPSVEVCRIVP